MEPFYCTPGWSCTVNPYAKYVHLLNIVNPYAAKYVYTPLTSHLLTLGGRRSYCTVFVYVLELCVERLAVQRTSVRMLEFEPGSSAGDPPGPTTTTTSLLYV